MEITLQNQFTKQELVTLLLIYAAHVDYELSQNEVDFILENSTIEIYDKMFEVFQNTSDYACMKILLQQTDILHLLISKSNS